MIYDLSTNFFFHILFYIFTFDISGDNFFQYACGAWNKKNVIPEDKSSFSTFEVRFMMFAICHLKNEFGDKNAIKIEHFIDFINIERF